MKRRTLLTGAATLAAAPLAMPHAQTPVTIRWWFHFDDVTATPAALVADFEKANPDIKIQAERIPWGNGSDYYNRLYTALLAGGGPDCASVRFLAQSRLMEMEALRPIDDLIASWPGRSDISDLLWKLHLAPDGKRYYLPVQYEVPYLYVRQDWLAEKNLKLPTDLESFLNVAKALTGGDRWGFGMRGGPGGHNQWGAFVLGGVKWEKGGLTTPAVLQANRWFIDLHRVHHVFPPSAPSDGFVQIIGNMKAGRTAMTIHHIGSANEMTAALGDRITAVTLPRGPGGTGWAEYRDESNAIFTQSKNPMAAWKWISYLSTSAPNTTFNKLSGQVSVTTSAGKNWDAEPQRFLDATAAGLPIAAVLPPVPQTAEFTISVWPQTTQKALLGQITPDEMMQVFDKHYFG